MSGAYMKFDDIPFGWLDFVTAFVLLLGILHGRKRGLSEELLGTLQWVAIVVVGGLFYQTLAQMLSTGTSVLSPTTYNLAAYVFIALTVKLLFSLLRRVTGEKLVGSDIFGRFEYYLGMVAGVVRAVCIYLFVMSFLHAPYYSKEMLANDARNQEKNFGDIRFPTLGAFQQSFFKETATGWASDHWLEPLLVRPAATQGGDLRGDNSLARRRERDIDSLMGGK
jgi:uncharacterized membrane protein required for colicin V production